MQSQPNQTHHGGTEMRLSESGKMTTTLQEAFEQYDRTRSARIAGAATIHAQSVAVAMIAYHINKANDNMSGAR